MYNGLKFLFIYDDDKLILCIISWLNVLKLKLWVWL